MRCFFRVCVPVFRHWKIEKREIGFGIEFILKNEADITFDGTPSLLKSDKYLENYLQMPLFCAMSAVHV